MDARKQELFGCAPISLEELGKVLFLAEGPLSPEQRKALEEAEERARKRSARKPRSPEGAPRPAAKAPKPLGTRAGPAEEVLRRAGTLFQPKERTLSALLDCFTPLVDESLFLSS